jgi:hypothetical protein
LTSNQFHYNRIPVRLLPVNTYTADPALTSPPGDWLPPETRGPSRSWAGSPPALGDACDRQPARLAALLARIECGAGGVDESVVFRLGTSLTRLLTARQAVAASSEVVECFGGAGHMEDTGIARLLRDARVAFAMSEARVSGLPAEAGGR